MICHDEFESKFDALPVEVQNELYAEAGFLEIFGPETGRPHVDTLKASDYANMKELRFEAADGEWPVAFAFDPKRRAILLVAGDKTGGSAVKFYKKLIAKADARYERHLTRLLAGEKKAKGEKGP